MNVHIKPYDFVFEHNNDTITIRKVENKKAIAEIICFEDTDEILINTAKEFVWCSRVIKVEFELETQVLNIRYLSKVDDGIKIIAIKVDN